MPLSANEWSLVSSQAVEKWKADPNSGSFPPFCHCNTKSDPQDNHSDWTGQHCFEVEQRKDNNPVIVCRLHDHVTACLRHDTCPLLTDLVSRGKVTKAVMCKQGYVGLLFSVGSLSDSTQYVMYLSQEYATSISSAQASPPNPTKQDITFTLDMTRAFNLYQCRLSPDATRICLLISTADPSQMSATDMHYDVHIYSRRPAAFDRSFRGNMFELEYQISGLQAYSGVPMALFDSRYSASRLWLINVRSFQFSEFEGYIKTYNINNKQIKIPQEDHKYKITPPHLLDCAHSPDGAYIVPLVIFREGELPEGFESDRALLIYDSDTLDRLKIVTIEFASPSDCYVNYSPVFSLCSRKMALRTKKHIKIYQLPVPKSLQATCRSVVLHYLGQVGLNRLQAPQQTIDYLQYKPYMS